jgi:4-hydroxybenzoate polyprenyltransferase
VPRAVVSLIAGIALLDAVLIAAAGAPGVAWLAVGGFVLTLGLQRLVPGT